MGERRDAAHIKGNESDMDGLLNLKSTSETYLHTAMNHMISLFRLKLNIFPLCYGIVSARLRLRRHEA